MATERCAAGFPLPKHGPCPECGADDNDTCGMLWATTLSVADLLKHENLVVRPLTAPERSTSEQPNMNEPEQDQSENAG